MRLQRQRRFREKKRIENCTEIDRYRKGNQRKLENPSTYDSIPKTWIQKARGEEKREKSKGDRAVFNVHFTESRCLFILFSFCVFNLSNVQTEGE